MPTNILDEYELEAEFAAANGVHQRTVARARQQGMPFMEWGGRIWIHVPGAKRVQGTCPPPQSQAGGVMAATRPRPGVDSSTRSGTLPC